RRCRSSVEASMSVQRNVTVPVGKLAIGVPRRTHPWCDRGSYQAQARSGETTMLDDLSPWDEVRPGQAADRHRADSSIPSKSASRTALTSSIRTIAAVPSHRADRWRWQADVIASPSRGVISFRNPHEHRYQAMMGHLL